MSTTTLASWARNAIRGDITAVTDSAADDARSAGDDFDRAAYIREYIESDLTESGSSASGWGHWSGRNGPLTSIEIRALAREARRLLTQPRVLASL